MILQRPISAFKKSKTFFVSFDDDNERCFFSPRDWDWEMNGSVFFEGIGNGERKMFGGGGGGGGGGTEEKGGCFFEGLRMKNEK